MKVLLVDDDRSTRYLFCRALAKRFGCEVTEAGDGLQALEALAHDTFDLAVLDVQMPNMDGLETLRALRDSPDYVSLPVVMLTGERDQTVIREILELGVLEYIGKPLNMARLSDRIRRILRTTIADRGCAGGGAGSLSGALKATNSPLLVIEGRTPFLECFADVFGRLRPVLTADSGVAGMRELATGNPSVIFIGTDLGVLSEPLLLRRIRTTPAFRRIPVVAIVDDQEEGDGRLVNYDGTLTRTLAPDTLARRMADLLRLGCRSGWDLPGFPPGFRATVMLLCEQIIGTALAADTMLCDLPVVTGGGRVRVRGSAVLPPGGDIGLEVACDVGTARRAATNLFGIDARMVRDEDADGAAAKVFDLIRSGLADIYPIADGGAFDQPAVGRVPQWVPRLSGDQGVALCVQAPAKEHEFWLQLEPLRN